jgi:hypothetical protein
LPAYDQTLIHIFITCASFWVISNVMGVLPQAPKIIIEVQRKRSNEKITRRKISFPTYKPHLFFFFSSLWTPSTISYLFKKNLNAIRAPPEVLQIIFEL